MLQLDVVELDYDDIPLAWPLVRTATPQLGLDAWRAAAESVIDRGGGVLAVTAADRALHGVATYEAIEKPSFGRVLHVETLVTFELRVRAPARRALIEALIQLSSALGCCEIVISAGKRPRSRGATVLN
jgi:hypothetical protein